MSYPLAGDVCELVRELLLANSAGAEANYPNTRILTMLGMAWRELWDALAAFGMPRPRETFYHRLPAYTSAFYPSASGLPGLSEVLKVEEGGVGSSLAIASISGAVTGEVVVTTESAHGLSNNARVIVCGANRQADGDWFVSATSTTELLLRGSLYRDAASPSDAYVVVPSNPALTDFTAVAPLTHWARRAPAATLKEYQWAMDRFRFHGATADRLLSVTALLASPPAPESESETLTVDNCHNFLAYRTAALLAGAQGRDDLFTRYSVMALGANQKPDGSGGFLAGLTSLAAKSAERAQTQRSTP